MLRLFLHNTVRLNNSYIFIISTSVFTISSFSHCLIHSVSNRGIRVAKHCNLALLVDIAKRFYRCHSTVMRERSKGQHIMAIDCMIFFYQEKVAGRFCPDPRPGPIDGCVAPCLNDCLLSEWNEWSPCSKTCSLARTGGHKTRFREILATSGPGQIKRHISRWR